MVHHMDRHLHTSTITLRMPKEDTEFLKALATEHDLSTNALLVSFLQRRIREIKDTQG
jgi:hypothetical protein